MAKSARDSQILGRIDDLISKGESALTTHRDAPPGIVALSERASLNQDRFAEWRSQSLAFLTGFLGKEHTYSQSFERRVESASRSNVMHGLGILRAVRADIDAGYLTTIRELIHADVYSDFLEMATHLLSEGYKDPAAVLAGGVLEEHLRQLCAKNGIDVERMTPEGPKPKKADMLNADLAKKGVYPVLEQKQVTAWLDLRNKAAHGKYDEYTEDQVSLFCQGLRDFLARNPA